MGNWSNGVMEKNGYRFQVRGKTQNEKCKMGY
jgi:hypothetical protein